MIRVALAFALAASVLPGCVSPFGIAGDTFEGLEGREVPVHVRITGVSGDWAGIEVVADVTAAGASWASLTSRSELGTSGVTQRFSDGTVALELDREWFSPASCTAGVCELDYVIALDAAPSAPWDVTLSVTVDGDGADTARVEMSTGS